MLEKNNFERTVQLCNEIGFVEFSRPQVNLSRAIVFLK